MDAPQNIIGLQAAEYVRAMGWPLVLLPPRSKGEHGMAKRWNHRENAATDPDLIARHHGNVGLLLAFAGVVSIDIDDYQAACEWLEARGVDLVQLLAAPDAVRIDSGVPNRAKLLYTVPAGIDAADLLTHRVHADDRSVILELRCAGKRGVSMQDVLPPSVHPGTGQPYRWRGDWHNLPVLPDALLRVWQREIAGDVPASPAPHGTAFLDVLDRLARAGCKPHVVAPGDARAHCPVHRGQSGTTLHVNENADGRVLMHCHAGCTWQDVFAALDMAPGPVPMLAVSPRNAPRNAQDADDGPPAPLPLPPMPAALCALPGRLGDVQAWIASTMSKPHDGIAGLVSLALVGFLSMDRTRIASRDGLAMGEFYLVLAPTGFGKERLRKVFSLAERYAARERIAVPGLEYNAPTSAQALQQTLIDSRCVGILADEFGDWIAKGDKEPHRVQAMAHFMHCYGNPFGIVRTPRAVTRPLAPVNEPRVVLFGTSTGERFAEVINGSMADAGFLNRFVILPVGNDPLELADDNDDAQAYEIPQALADMVKTLAVGDKRVTFDADATEYKRQHYRAVLDPLAGRDPRLAARVNEQALRMAAAIALSDGRRVIDVRDLGMAYEIREGLYARTAALFEAEAVLSADNATMRALSQVRGLLKRHASFTHARLRDHSRQFRALHVREQTDVLRMLAVEGACVVDGARIRSLLHGADNPDK